MVTDGVNLWVVYDSGTDKVFKYTVAGALVCSSTIDAANSQPTGITIDPSNVSNIWIVDSGADKVFQYTAAASRSSGSQIADMSFALAVGNTNPQGIADPPMAPAATRIGKAAAQVSRATQSMQERAVDEYLSTEPDRMAGGRIGSLDDSFLDTLLGVDQRQGKLRTLKHGLR